MPELLTQLQSIFRDVLDDPALVVSRQSSANTVPGWDSLAHINLVGAIEHQFHVKFALGELQRLKNVGDLVDLLQTKMGRA